MTNVADDIGRALDALIDPRAHLLIATSGGIDSIVLLHVLRFVLSRPGRITAVHVNHRMRSESTADAQWLAGVCAAWGVPLVVRTAPEPPSGETAARAVRYQLLAGVARDVGADAVVTAHHADDVAETLLFRLARGTGLRGLAGIPARRALPANGGVIPLLRPMLGVTRTDVRAYARARGIRWREDPTNATATTARNRIRHQLLPGLERARPGAVQRLRAIAAAATELEKAWDDELGDVAERVDLHREGNAVSLAREAFLRYDPTVRTRLLRRELRRLGHVPDQSGTRAIMEFISSGASGKTIRLAGGIRVHRERDRIVARTADPERADQPVHIHAPGPGAGVAMIGGRTWQVRWHLADEAVLAMTAAFEPSELVFPLEVRGWHAGDRIRLKYGSKKLKKLFLEAGIGRHERARTPVLAGADGRILWVAGCARAHDVPAGPFHVHVA